MNRIKEALIEAGISQTELAKRLGKGFNMVNLYATNRKPPRKVTQPDTSLMTFASMLLSFAFG